jgi:hypothetical protein
VLGNGYFIIILNFGLRISNLKMKDKTIDCGFGGYGEEWGEGINELF